MTAGESWRVLLDDPADGPANMARDETLMLRVGSGHSPPTLRFYRWSPPAVSLGYFQSYADYQSLPPPVRSLPVVRRLTGGGAILHDLELTYSIALPATHPLLSKGPNRLYEIAHDAAIAALASVGLNARRCGASDDSGPNRGPFFCFARRHCYDLLIGDDKIVGSAQRRTRYALLQHGSIILGNRFPQQPAVLLDGPFDAMASRVRSTMTEAFAEWTAMSASPGEWTESELREGESLIGKYAGDEWTRRI